MRKLLAILLFLPGFAFSQPYGNEWLNFNQDYYKIMVPGNGVYKITYADLQNVGMPINSTNPGLIQMYRRGQEIAVHIEGDDDGSFDPADYLLFYGQRNDGQLDEELYVSPEAQPHKYLALYADSAAYFLTVGASPGKRMPLLPGNTGQPQDNWVNHEIIKALQDNYAPGIVVGENTSLTKFDFGEGFTGPRATEVSNPNRDIDLTGIDFPFLTGPSPTLELTIVGRNKYDHQFEVLIGPDAADLVPLRVYSFNGYTHIKVDTTIAWDRISTSGNLKIRVSVLNNGGNRSNISISAVKLTYARTPEVNNANLLEVSPEIKLAGGSSLVFDNVPFEAQAYEVLEPYNCRIFTDTNPDLNKVELNFADATIPRKIALAVPKTNFSIRQALLRNLNPANHDYLIISHDALMQPAGNYSNVVRDYAAYRASATGGSFDTLVVNVRMLYNQFSFGQPTPLAIYRFMQFMAAGGDPEYLFLIGKGLDVSEKFNKTPNWVSALSDYVPTGGSPGSDLAYTVGLGVDPNAAEIPVGRLSVMKPIEVANYLDKVKEMEPPPFNELWRKNVLHLSGGDNLEEIEEFRFFLQMLEDVARGPYFGAEVKTVYKQTTNPVEEINVAAEVNEGVNLITFFGHSSPNTSDIDIGFASNPINGYENQGKYPLILMNGCETGNIYERAFLFGEDWIKTPDRGATGVIAHSSYGYPNQLWIWSNLFYQVAYSDSIFIEKSVGEILVETSKRFLNRVNPTPTIISVTQAQQMGLQGDPAIKLFGTYRPDYEITEDNVELLSFNGGDVTAEEDSFALVLGVRNFGAFVQDSLEIAVQRTLADFTVLTDTLVFAPVKYSDTLQITLSNLNIEAAGANIFDIHLDPRNKIIELDELNNFISTDRLIKTSGTVNILPYNYNLQAKDTVDLFFQPGNPLMKARQYLVELDIAADYTSPYKMELPPQVGNKLLSIKDIDLLDTDTATYYWRTKYALPGENESDEWTQSSFSVIDGAMPGWAQLEYPQHKENQLSGLEPKDAEQKLDFVNSSASVTLRVPGSKSDTLYYHAPSNTLVRDGQLNINGVNYLYFVNRFQPFTYCYYNTLNVVAIDKESSLPYAPVFGIQTDRWACGRAPEIINAYPNGNSVTLDSMINAIGDGDKVILFTVGSFDFNTLSAATLAKLEDLGADAGVLLSKEPGGPYILLGEKGAGTGNSFAEIVADPGAGIPVDEQTISYSGELTGTYSHGNITTGQIGPAQVWQTLYLDVKTPNPADLFGLELVGYNLQGEATVFPGTITDPMTDLSTIDATIYPYLKLRLAVEDTVDLSAPQLEHWIVNYEPTVEGVLTFDSLNEAVLTQLTLNEGEDSVRLRMSFHNISDKPYQSDSLWVIFSSFNRTSRSTLLNDSIKIAAPLPGESEPIKINFDPDTMIGENDFNINVNPMLEVEQSFANNRINMPNYLTVIRDETNPVLDVSFDGEYIFDGDIVSPNPNIAIIIRDENPYLLKSDTTGINILLKRPCENCILERIPLSGDDIVWTAEDEKNPYTIDFTPKSLENGIYELQVQVADATGNLSATEPYKISFEVINESTVTNFYPYPNPFSTSVKFIFTLTGNELPDELMIRIMTVSGRIVREILQEELGPLKIGNNVTDYAWDGRDEFGDQLANGVYLYKVFMRQNGQNVELRPSAGDRGFTNGYGKLYLLR